MPGSGNLIRIGFPNRTPVPAIFVTVLLFANLVGLFAVDQWVKRYAPHQPSLSFPFPVKLKPGVDAFAPSWLGRYEQWGFWLHFVLLGLVFLVYGWYVFKGQAVLYTRSQRHR